MKTLAIFLLLCPAIALSQLYRPSGGGQDSRVTNMRVYNVIDYGADPTASRSSSSAIQSAIDAAFAATYHANSTYWHNGVVVVPQGRYLIDSTLRLQRNTTLIGEDGALLISYPGGSSDTVIAIYGSYSVVRGFKISGWNAPGQYKYIAIALYSSAFANAVQGCRVSDIFIRWAGKALDLSCSGTGYTNGNIFNNMWIDGCKSTFRLTGAGKPSGNQFSDITVQCTDSTRFIIDSLAGSWNMFSSVMVWDYLTPNPDASSLILANSDYNSIRGGDLAYCGLVNNGRYTTIDNADGVSTVGRSLYVPNAIRQGLHAIVAGDSVFGNTFLRSSDSTIVTWNGTSWVVIKDLTP